MKKYDQLTRKEKQLIALEYPYKADSQLWDTTRGHGYHDTAKFFSDPQDIVEMKEAMAEEDVSLINRRNFVTGSKTTTKGETISILDSTLSHFGEEAYRTGLEMAEKEMDPAQALKELYIIQANRLAMGVQYEQEVGLGNNPETEVAVARLESIIRTYNDVVNGQKIDMEVKHSLSKMISEMDVDFDDEEDDDLIIDIQGDDLV